MGQQHEIKSPHVHINKCAGKNMICKIFNSKWNDHLEDTKMWITNYKHKLNLYSEIYLILELREIYFAAKIFILDHTSCHYNARGININMMMYFAYSPLCIWWINCYDCIAKIFIYVIIKRTNNLNKLTHNYVKDHNKTIAAD